MKVEVLRALKENLHQYISGEQLSKNLGVSRTAVWKYISELREEGYCIESSSRKGYKLVLAPDNVSAAEIQASLNTDFFGKHIIYHDTVLSTNITAKEIAAKGCKDGTVIIADQQTAGKGRLGRSWVSPPKSGVWMSIVLRPQILPAQACFVTILAALAVSKAIEQVVGIKADIKWPNDIIIHRKKVCGILTEMSAEIERINYVVVGIGINVNTDVNEFSDEIKSVATSIRNETGSTVSRKNLIISILQHFEQIYEQAFKKDMKSELINNYKRYSLTIGSRVRAVYRNAKIEGNAEDINEDGELIIRTDDGERHIILSGEVSVRGLDGYV